MKIAVLGRQPEFGLAELWALGCKNVQPLTPEAAEFSGAGLDINRLGSVKKLGDVLFTTSRAKLPFELKKYVQKTLLPTLTQDARKTTDKIADGVSERRKVTIGISAYGGNISAKDAFNLGVVVKKTLRARDISVRLIPNTTPELSTAQSFHNGLGSRPYKLELLIVAQNDRFTVAQMTGVQNPNAYAARDQKRPKRDAFVGMLPPKLAQTMINLAVGNASGTIRLLDPFCGTGVILQEASLMGCDVYGTDISPKMIDYSRINLEWLKDHLGADTDVTLEVGDAQTHQWQGQIDCIASEIYLGHPLSAPPSFAKLQVLLRQGEELLENFLKNLAPQLESGTHLCLAIPAWRQESGGFSRLNLDFLSRLEYNVGGKSRDLLYAREQQIVARDLIVLEKR
ncbi:methyltransferase domain-containing protein [Candidatus Saccharibacteria bacterium]|nr:methyltransferase domain-containing protein [Candidatus Saccharibacteria bacterium]